jgi:hypothetical protein
MLNNGNGTFSVSETEPSGGQTWMLNVADVNGDGHDDVVTANSTNNNGGVLLGNGNGQLGPVTTYPTDPFALATDVGDLDGDGDLDWITSAFSGDWWVYLNNGAGQFTFSQELPASISASCAVIVDIDNDRDLDVALVDEIADELWIYKNGLSTHSGELTGVELNTGVILAGGIRQMEKSDENVLRTRSGFGTTFVDLHHMQMVVSASTAHASPTSLDLKIVAAINQPSGIAQVALRNWNTGNFDSVGQYAINNQESTFRLNNANASLYVGPSGEIQLRMKHIVFVPFLAFTFESMIDQVEFIVE